jgi:hypothetical protein
LDTHQSRVRSVPLLCPLTQAEGTRHDHDQSCGQSSFRAGLSKLVDEVSKTRREGFFSQLAVHGSEPLSEMIANRETEIAFVLSGQVRQRLHEIPRRNSDGCSHVLSPHKDRCRPTAQANWPKLMADDFSHRKALDSSMTGLDCGKNVTEVLEIKIVPRCDVNVTRRDCFCVEIADGRVGSRTGR